MNKKHVNKRASKSPKKFPVPEWMDEDLKLQAQWLDPLQRHTLAEKLERQAEQLREMKQTAIKPVVRVEVLLRPHAKRAVLAFAKLHGADDKENEPARIRLGTEWSLDSALPLFATVSRHLDQWVRYRDAEDLEDSVLNEALIAKALVDFEKDDDSQDD